MSATADRGLDGTVRSMNTAFHYMYRDASNYKSHRTVVFAGEITDAQRATIDGALDDGEWFLPAQVGLEALQSENSTHYDDDHIWHEITDIELVSDRPTDDRTIAQFADAFTDITWDVETAAAVLEEWMNSTPRGA